MALARPRPKLAGVPSALLGLTARTKTSAPARDEVGIESAVVPKKLASSPRARAAGGLVRRKEV